MTALTSRHLSVFATLTVLALGACSDGLTAADAGNNEAVAQGAVLYGENCASCHGENLEGQPNWKTPQADGTLPAPPHDDSGHTWHHPDALLFDVTKRGGQASAPEGFKSGMPAFAATMSDGEIWATLSYIKSRWSLTSQTRQGRLNKMP